MPKKRRNQATDLEQTVLGIVWRDGPCTPYHVRSVLLRSPSSHWSGSAGAIYPLVKRLEARGLVRSRAVRTGERVGRELELTEAGRGALRAWLASPLTPDALAVQIDPVRTRLFFLGALEPEARARLLADVQRRLEEEAVRVRGYETQELAPDDEFGRLASRGAHRAMEARLEWIREFRRAVAGRSRARAVTRRQ